MRMAAGKSAGNVFDDALERANPASRGADDNDVEIRHKFSNGKKRDVATIGIPAGAGALIGGLTKGGKGAAVGSAVGGAAGTGVVLATRGKEVRLGRGAPVAVRLLRPVRVSI